MRRDLITALESEESRHEQCIHTLAIHPFSAHSLSLPSSIKPSSFRKHLPHHISPHPLPDIHQRLPTLNHRIDDADTHAAPHPYETYDNPAGEETFGIDVPCSEEGEGNEDYGDEYEC